MNLDETLNNLVPEDVPENVYESDKFPPRWQPGTRVRFIFKFEEDRQDRPAVSLTADNKVVRVAFQAEATHVITKDGEQAVPATSSGNQPIIRFQSVDSRQFKRDDGSIVPSSLHRLFRAIVGRDAAKLTGTDPRLIIAKMRELEGRETFDGLIGWKLYNGDTNTEYSTGTKKSKEYEKRDGTVMHNEPWPTVDGQPARSLDGEMPRDFISSFIEKKVTAVMATVTVEE